ncbi:hypothetical protein AW736_17055 [Termitidicoccus mucosus]|uniref:Uncharacterized protein n=2 Tax=Termitidicoccus mucosus TaxID=1184151 RepID=A0A178IEW5_9BACT|nr:hypothetical protein AW736_17055 [Opitutaceae bacterium TSB47]
MVQTGFSTNLARQIGMPAARKLAADRPAPNGWNGREAGMEVRYPAWNIDRDFAYARHRPIKESYQACNPAPRRRPCWGLTLAAAHVSPS